MQRGELQGWRKAVQLFLPVTNLTLRGGAQNPLLPHGEICVLDRQFAETGRGALTKRMVQRLKFVKEVLTGPTVHCNVMESQMQHVIVGRHSKEPRAKREILNQIERPVGFLDRKSVV